MDFDDRLGWLVVGCLLGFGLGYSVRLVRELRRVVEGGHMLIRKESGFIRFPVVANIALAMVICVTVGAAVSAQQAKNQIDLAVVCNQKILDYLLIAINERTDYATSATQSNVDLQKSQSSMLEILLHNPPHSETRQDRAGKEYLENLRNFLELSEKADEQRANYSYPTVGDLNNCLNKK